jgi:RNA polymerase sigma-70 factor (ECF subfamily)
MNWESLESCNQIVLSHIADGNYRDALEAMVLGYQNAMVGFCTNMLGDQIQAEETAQEIFCVAFQAMPRYRQTASVRTWLFSIARKQCFKFMRTQRQRGRIERERQTLIAEGSHRDPSLSPEDDPEAEVREVRQALQQLDKAERSLLLMRYDSGLQITDLAHILGISVSTVRRRLARALDHLREVVNDDPR